MHPFTCLCVVVNICMIFHHIQEHLDAHHLFYDRSAGLFEITVFQDFFRCRKKDNRLCGFLFFSAVAGMPRLTARFPSCFFPAVCDLFPFDRLRGRNRGVFIVTVDLCTQFQVFPPFFFQFSSCFIILQTDLFCFIQCIIPLFFSIQCTFFHFFQFLLSLSFCLFKFPLHIFQYLKPIITDTDRFSMGGCQILR